MPLDKERKTVERTQEETYYQCDKCDERSQWREDFNFVVLNPERRRMVTQPRTNKDTLSWDGVMMLCDEHLEELQETLADSFGVKLHDEPGLVLDPEGPHGL